MAICARERGLFEIAALVGTLARLNGVGQSASAYICHEYHYPSVFYY